MSWQAIEWAFEQEVSGGAKLLLLALAHRADIYGITFVGREHAARLCGFSPKSVSDNMKRLEEAGLIERFQRRRPNGSRTSDWTVLAAGQCRRAPMEVYPHENLPLEVLIAAGWAPDRGSGEESSPNDSAGGQVKIPGSPEPAVVEPSVNGGSQSSSEWTGVPDEMRSDAEEAIRGKTTVSGRIVTPSEMQRAAVSLAEFNRQLERSFSIVPNLNIVVRRVREHPSWDAAKHVRLVQSACRLRWWERNGRRRPPSPKVIWGSPECFENVAQDAAREAAVVSEREEDFALHDKVWPDGRRWSELSGREQQVAKDAVMVGLKPWVPTPAPVAAVSTGNGHAPGWTAANFAS